MARSVSRCPGTHVESLSVDVAVTDLVCRRVKLSTWWTNPKSDSSSSA